LFDASAEARHGHTSVGIAPHSLRAVTDSLLHEVLENLAGRPLAAVHVHVAEQAREVEECMAWSGERPVEWLLNRFDVDEKWCAIHATHMTAEETRRLARSGAVAGLCPTTEANLGDGFFNLSRYLEDRGCWAIGSDSHISISPVEELRWLEYGQRLLEQQRNVMATESSLSTGMALLEGALRGGAQSSGMNIGQLEPGFRADFVVLDTDHARLYNRQGDQVVDSWIFSGNENLVREVYVGGVRVIADGHHEDEEDIRICYHNTLDELSRD
jgi:formimidoylglutamate deiminase